MGLLSFLLAPKIVKPTAPEKPEIDWAPIEQKALARATEIAESEKFGYEEAEKQWTFSASKDGEILTIDCGNTTSSLHIRNYVAEFWPGTKGKIVKVSGILTPNGYLDTFGYFSFRMYDDYKSVACDKYVPSKYAKVVIAGIEMSVPPSRLEEFKSALNEAVLA